MASIISAGTTSSTSLVASGDTSGVLQLATNNGTTAVTIDTAQNVVVGATSALAKINSISAGAALGGTAQLAIGSSTNDFENTYFRIDNSGNSNFCIDQKVSGVFYNRFYIERTTGNVLVGTTSNASNAKVNIAQGSSDGSQYQIMQFTGGSGTGGNEVGGLKRQTTANVANSATTILSVMNFGELITVTGVTPSNGAIFSDLLMAGYNTVSVISSNTQQNSPASRTYSVSSGALRLTMGSSAATNITVQSLICGARGA